ncbi:hypothetical protein C3L33_06687, partial [Rhododendron williamsianum]
MPLHIQRSRLLLTPFFPPKPKPYTTKPHPSNPLSSLLHLCKHPLHLQQIHARFILHGLHQNPSLSSTLIDAYANFGHLGTSQQVFRSVSDPNTPLYTSFLRCLYRCGEYEKTLLVFQEMVSKSIHPDECVYPFVLSSCSQLLDDVMGKMICGYLLKLGFDCNDFVGSDLAYYSNDDNEQGFRILNRMRLGRFDPDSVDLICMLRSSIDLNSLNAGRCAHSLVLVSSLWKDMAVSTALLTMYSKLGSIKDARLVFDKMPERDCFVWNLMISGYSRNGLQMEALQLLMGMVRSGVRADLCTAIPAISSIGELKSLRWGQQMHAHVIRNGSDYQVSVYNSLIGMYCDCNSSETARRLFDLVTNKTVVSWSAMIKGYVNHDCFHDALALLTKMKLEGFRVDSVTVINILPACVNIGALEQVKNLHGYSIKCALDSFVSLNTALLISYAKCGCIEMARKLFDDEEVDNKDIITWNSMISAYSKHGDWFHCRELYSQMKQSKVKPDHVTFLGLLTSCVNSGFVEEGRECFKEMTETYFCQPNQEHYASMVDLLGRSGHVKEASELINTMPFKPDSRVWGPLLSACKMHNEPKLAELAAEKLIAMEPKNAGNYILISNIYAAAGKWDGVAKMRVFLRDRGLKKVPGCSWLEINGKVHEFRVADRSHLNSDDIYTTLENLELEIKDREKSSKRNQIVLLKEFSECKFV